MVKRVFLLLISFYQRFVSPGLPKSCRYQPTCSEYAREAISVYGAMRGSYLTFKRLARCHPWGGSGYDPVPQPRESRPSGPGEKHE